VPEVVREWFIAFGVVVIALAVGWIIDTIVVGILRVEAGPAHKVRSSMALALRGQPEIWCVLFAIAYFRPFDSLASGSLKWIDHITVALAILSVTLFLSRLVGWLIRAYLSKDTVDSGGSIFINLARMVVWAVGLTIMLGSLQLDIGPLVASLGVVGLAVSLGLQDTLANFFSGLQVTMSRQILPGQYIKLSTAEEGTVIDVTWRNTTLRSPSNDLVIVPNSVVARAQITNFTADDEQHTAVIPFTVKYGSDLEDVKRVALGVARDVRDQLPGTIKEYEPTVRFRAFGPEGIAAAVTIRVERYQERLPIVSALVERLHSNLAEQGFEFGTGLSVTAAKPL
jgi:small-conductance mechanosensitive channel